MVSSRISFNQVLQLVDVGAFGLSSGEESEFEGEVVTGYLPAVDGYLSTVLKVENIKRVCA